MPRLSIVVPFLGNLKLLEDTLVSVLENRPESCQIIVVLNEGYSDPYELHGEVSFVASRPDAGLMGGIFRGLMACEAPVVHVLACGIEVAPGWTDAALPHFDNPQVGAVAPLVLGRERPHRVVSAGLGYRRNGRVRPLCAGRSAARAACGRHLCGPDARAAFYRRSALMALDDYRDRRAFGLTDIDLALSLRAQGYHCVLEPECSTYAHPALTSACGAFATGFEESRLFWRWASHYGWRGSLASHAALLLGECLSAIVWPPRALRAAGRLAGACYAALPEKRHVPNAPAGVVPAPHFHSAAQRRQLASATTSRDSESSNLSLTCSSGPAAPRRAPG